MRPAPGGDSLRKLWVIGGIYTALGLFMGVFDHPLVPITYAFHLLPISIGGGLGLGVLREKFGPLLVIGYYVLAFWLMFACFSNRTTFAPLALFCGTFCLTRATLRWHAENGG